MLKKSILSLLFLAAIGYVSAQSLQFELNGEVFEDGQTVFCNEFNSDYGEYIQDMQLRNISGNDLNVIVRREILCLPENSMTYFCWGMCFGPNVDESTEPVSLPAGEISGEGLLGFHFMPIDPTTDVAIVKYYAYDERHADESVSIVIAYNTAESVNDNSRPMSMSSAYPNPARSMVHFDYSLPNNNATAVVYNVVGQEIMRQDINTFEGQLNLSVADLIDGIYFCSIMLDGKTANTVKFVVKK